MVIGIPGDEEHRRQFGETADIWRQWLKGIAGVKDADITLLVGSEPADNSQPATSENIQRVAGQLSGQIGPDDSLWVLLIGHGSQDRRHGWFHLPGPDMNGAEWAGLFTELKAGEQVFWLTHAASGSFLKPMSLPGRIVITATDADGEVNETRFPHALAEIMQQQLALLDTRPASQGAATSVLDLFRAATEGVDQSFEDEQLVPTEHAQLDDNGDGVGTESIELATTDTATEQTDPSLVAVDGLRADRVTIGVLQKQKMESATPPPEEQPISPTRQNP
jgi:hypothetical protein